MVTATPYGKSGLSVGSKLTNLTSDPVYTMLVTSAYTPNADTHQFKSDVTNEITGTGYTAGGLALSGITFTYDATNHFAVLKAGNAAWAAATFTFRYAINYVKLASDATSPLLSWADLITDQSPSGVTYELDWDATNGIWRINQ